MILRALTAALLALFLSAPVRAQETLVFTPLTPLPSPVAVPFHVDLDGLTALPDSVLQLVAVKGARQTPIPFQIRQGLHRTLHWMVDAGFEADRFELRQTQNHPTAVGLTATAEDSLLMIRYREAPLLGYQFGVMAAPDSADPAYARSGFIHPVYSPAGHLLTRIQPEDHYHHYGIWNPWTQTEYEGRVVDFWNLAKREGTVRFAGFLSRTEGPVFSEFQTHHEHVVFSNRGEEVALNELQTVRVYRPAASGYYLVDLTSELSLADTSALRLLEYRYGGLGWRGPEGWLHENSTMITSEGRTREDADGSTARWISITGGPDDARRGIVIMSHAANYNHPEPLRVWPPEANEHGDVFVNYSPTKTKEWLLVPGRRYALRYRFIVFDGSMPADRIDLIWHNFARGETVRVEVVAE